MTLTRQNVALLSIATSLAAWALPAAALAQKQLVRLKFDGPVLETPTTDDGLAILFGGSKPKSLRTWVEMIRKAADDPKIAGAMMVIESPEVNIAQVEELTRAMQAFRAKGKKIYCYLDEGSNLTYALAAAADHVTLAEHSTLMIPGLNGQLWYYKGTLDKLGVKADMLHCGAYKSALEPYTRTEPSPEARENVEWLLDGIFDRWINLIAEGRKLTPEQVKAAVDSAPLDAKPALEKKLVDAVGSFPAFKQMLQKEFGKDVAVVKSYDKKGETFDLSVDASDPFTAMMKTMEQLNKLFAPEPESDEPGIGLIYLEGPITLGRSEMDPFGGAPANAGSSTLRAALEKAREDDAIKAVVLRVDSPGGSAVASDIIWEAATRLAREKPLIVSMGRVAGSGGYYVAIPGDTIFAEETTITGSIGVVGGKLVWKGLMGEKLGMTVTEINRGKNAALFSPNREWSDAERAWVQKWMEGIYEQFKGRVKTSRGERIKGDLEQLAGGRVYTGRQAVEKGLVDKLGGLSDAIEFAARKVGLSKYEVRVLPKKKDFMDLLKMLAGEETEDEYEVRMKSALLADPSLRAALPLLGEAGPRELRELLRGLENLMILHRDRVACFVPFELRVR